MDQRFKPSVTVAAVIERDGLFLLVEEETSDGLRLNQPAGHLEVNESLVEAAVREVAEETAHVFAPAGLVGVYQWPLPQRDLTYLRFAFSGTAIALPEPHALDEGIVRTVWMGLDALRASVDRHRSPLVLQCVEDWVAGCRFPLDLIRHYDR